MDQVPQRPTRLPRNSKLSAYYTPSAASAQTAASTLVHATTVSHGVDSPSDELPTTGGRDAAIAYAKQLVQHLSLTDLMTRSSDLRAQATHLSSALHLSSRHYYQHLSASGSAAHSAVLQARTLTLTPTTADTHKDATARAAIGAIEMHTKRCAAIASRLDASRQRVHALHGVQQLQQLRCAAMSLAESLEALFDAATGLCTDGTTARHALLTAARRHAALMPALRALGAHHADFAAARDALARAAAVVRVAARRIFFPLGPTDADDDDDDGAEAEAEVCVDDGDMQALSLLDATQLRVLLGERAIDLRDDFCRAATRRICASTPSRAACAVAEPSALRLARLHISFCTAELLPRLFDATASFHIAFPTTTPDDNAHKAHEEEEGDALFAMWVHDAADQMVTARVRRALQTDVVRGADAADVNGLSDAIETLVTRARGAKDTRVAEVVRAVAQHLRDTVAQAVRRDSHAALRHTVRDVLRAPLAQVDAGAVVADADGDGAAARVLGAVREVRERCAVFPQEAWMHTAQLVRQAALLACAHAVQGDTACVGQCAALCRGLAASAALTDGEAGGEGDGEEAVDVRVQLEEASANMTDRATRVVLQRMQELLHVRVRIACRSDVGKGEGADEGADAMAAFEALAACADVTGASCGIAALRRGHLHSDEIGGQAQHHGLGLTLRDERLVRCAVVAAWVEHIRGACIARRAGVALLCADAARVASALGQADVERRVSAAADERCIEPETDRDPGRDTK